MFRSLKSSLTALILTAAVTAFGAGSEQTINTVPSPGTAFMSTLQTFLNQEDADRFDLIHSDFVSSGGVISTGAGLTKTPTSLVAFIKGFYTTESGSITFDDDDTCWIIADKDLTGDEGTFTRVSGTHYLMDCASSSEPALPADTVWIAEVTTASGSVTAVTDKRVINVDGIAATATGTVRYDSGTRTIGDVRLESYTVATRPTCDTAGDKIWVTDATSNGAVAVCDGSSWLYIVTVGAIIGGDLVEVGDAAITSSDATLTSATAAFVATDVGKYVNVEGADTAGATLTTTIASYTSATEVELTDTAATTVSGANMQFFNSFKDEIDAALASHDVVVIERSTLPYGMADGVAPASNKTLILRGDLRASWQEWPSWAVVKRLINIEDVSNVNVVFQGGSLDGQKARNDTGTAIALRVYDSDRVNIVGAGLIHDMPGQTTAGGSGGDAIWIGGDSSGTCDTESVYIGDGLVLADNVRQGLTVTCGVGIAVHGLTIKGTTGTDPGCGIDLEPNTSTQVLRGVSITDSYIADNNGCGIVVGTSATQISTGVTIDSNFLFENGAEASTSSADIVAIGYTRNVSITNNHIVAIGKGIVLVDTINSLVQGNTIENGSSGTSEGIRQYTTGSVAPNVMANTKILNNVCREMDIGCYFLDMTTLGSGTIMGLQVIGNASYNSVASGTTPVFWIRADNASAIINTIFERNSCYDTRTAGSEADECGNWTDTGATTADIRFINNMYDGTALGWVGLYNQKITGPKALITLCGDQANNTTNYSSPVAGFPGGAAHQAGLTANDLGFGLTGTGCDAEDSTTEATADEPVYANNAFYVTGMACTVGNAGSNGTTINLRSAAANLTPDVTCTIPTGETTCAVDTTTTVPIAAGATFAMREITTENLSATNVWCQANIALVP